MKKIELNIDRYNKLKSEVERYLNGEFESLNKPNNVYIIDIEGLDVSGKETFSKSLLHEFEKRKYDCALDIDIRLIDFPTPTNEVFSEIMDELNREEKMWSQKELDALFAINRYLYIKNIYKDIKAANELHPKRKHIIICDRFYFSNVLYCHLRSEEYKEYFFDEAARRTFYYAKNALKKERNLLGSIDQLAMFFIGSKKEQRKLYEKELVKKQKAGKSDGNETLSKQKFLNKIITKFLLNNNHDVYSIAMTKDCQSLKSFFKIAIGDNWNNNDYENAIIDALLYKIIGRENLNIFRHFIHNSIEFIAYDGIEISNEYPQTVNDMSLVSLYKIKEYYMDYTNDNALPFEIYCRVSHIHDAKSIIENESLDDNDFTYIDASIDLKYTNKLDYMNFILNKTQKCLVYNFIDISKDHAFRNIPEVYLTGTAKYTYHDPLYALKRLCDLESNVVSEFLLLKVPNKIVKKLKYGDCIGFIKLT